MSRELDGRVVLRVERDDRRPRPRALFLRPAFGTAPTRACVDAATRSEDLDVDTRVSVRGRNEADAAVLMLVVVPVRERRYPLACIVETREAGDGICWAVLESAEQRFRERVVVGHARPAERRHNSETLQRREHRGSLHRAAVVRVQHPPREIAASVLTHALDEPRGMVTRLRLVYVPTEDLPAPHILDEVEEEELSANVAAEVRDVP